MLRFDRYTDGVYVGYQTVDRDIGLTGPNSAGGNVVVTLYDAAGNQLVQLCGAVSQTRL